MCAVVNVLVINHVFYHYRPQQKTATNDGKVATYPQCISNLGHGVLLYFADGCLFVATGCFCCRCKLLVVICCHSPLHVNFWYCWLLLLAIAFAWCWRCFCRRCCVPLLIADVSRCCYLLLTLSMLLVSKQRHLPNQICVSRWFTILHVVSCYNTLLYITINLVSWTVE
jgi:hypothetical protein